MDALPKPFDTLEPYKQFIIYMLKPRNKHPDKMDKIPICNKSFRPISALEPGNWLDARTALATAKLLGGNYGVGFVLTENDPFWLLDIDDCLEPCGKKWSKIAEQLVTEFPDAAIEISQSKKGLHLIGSGIAPNHSCKNPSLKLEFYTSNRFIALTGISATGSATIDFTAKLS